MTTFTSRAVPRETTIMSSTAHANEVRFNSRCKNPELRALSNFAACSFSDTVAHTVEAEYQARKVEAMFVDSKSCDSLPSSAKTRFQEYANRIRREEDPVTCKKMGSLKAMATFAVTFWPPKNDKAISKNQVQVAMKKRQVDHWLPQNEIVMEELVRAKFNPQLNRQLWEVLDGTGNKALHEVGRPSFWTRAGKDKLGQILTRVRSELRGL